MTRHVARAPATQRGAALLQAMLTVALVATFAAGAAWHQWRSIEVETAERGRMQTAWLLSGALDWARLILREDARSGGADHLSEPWAVALQESRLSSFIASAQGVSSADLTDVPDAFLSGRISDAQARLNLTNLASTRDDREPAWGDFARLFELLGLSDAELRLLTDGLRAATDTRPESRGSAAPLMPTRVEQLTWLGLSVATVRALAPHVVLLPVTTPLNLNTASAELIHAVEPKITLADAQRLVSERDRDHLRSVAEAAQRLQLREASLNESRLSVSSRFFEVRGRLRVDQTVIEERSLVRRDGLDVRVVWRERVAQPS